jgi:hypothetical protein
MVLSRVISILVMAAIASMVLAVSGCGVLGPDINEKDPAVVSFRENTRRTIAQRITPKMTLADVEQIWASFSPQVLEVPSFEKDEQTQPGAKPQRRLILSNPYRSETRLLYEGDEPQLIVIHWHYTDLKENDGRITDDELTPVVFMNDRVVGWGRPFLTQMNAHLKQKKARKNK